MKYLFIVFSILLTSCIKDTDIYQAPEVRETFIRGEKGYKTMIIAGNDTIVTSQTVKVKYIKE